MIDAASFDMTMQVSRLPETLDRHAWLTLAADIEQEWVDDDDDGVILRPEYVSDRLWRRIQAQQRALLGVLSFMCADWIAWEAQEHGCTRGRRWHLGKRDWGGKSPRWPVHQADELDRCSIHLDGAVPLPGTREGLPSLRLRFPNTDEALDAWPKRLRHMLAEISAASQ